MSPLLALGCPSVPAWACSSGVLGELKPGKVGGGPVLRPSRGLGHSIAGLRVAPSHLTRGRVAAHSSPGLEAEESTQSVGNHHQTSKERGSRALVVRSGALRDVRSTAAAQATKAVI